MPGIDASWDTLFGVGGEGGVAAFLARTARLRPGLFGAGEYSVSLARGRAARGRVLVQGRRGTPGGGPAPAELEAGAAAVFSWLARSAGADLGAERFRSLFACVYGRGAPAPARFGLGLECDPSGPRGLRAYFDLFAQGPRSSAARRDALLWALDADGAWAEAMAALGARPVPPARIFGVDFAPGGPAGVKVYLPAARFEPGAVWGAAAQASPEAGRVLAAVLGALAHGGVSPLALPSSLLGVALPVGGGASWTLKLDVHLPDLAPDDRSAARAVERVLALLDLDPGPYRAAAGLALEGAAPEDARGVHQYLSLDVGRGGIGKANVYFRPRSSGAEWLPERSRPRLLSRPAPLSAHVEQQAGRSAEL